MKLSELFKKALSEGVFVVKNKSGKEKRFKSVSSPEAMEWKNSESPSKTAAKAPEKFSDDYWTKKYEGGYTGTLPDTKITTLTYSDFENMPAVYSSEDMDFTFIKRGQIKVGDTTCATADLRFLVSHDKREMGYDEDGRIEETFSARIRRSEKKPDEFVFVRFLG